MVDLRGIEIDGRHYACAEGGAWLHGLDVSHHQHPGRVPWAEHRSAAFGFARAAYGNDADTTFGAHVADIRAAGLKPGGYLFYRQSESALEQLQVFERQLRAAEIGPGDLAPVVDFEWGVADIDKPTDTRKMNQEAAWLCEQLAAQYGQCILYTAGGFINQIRRGGGDTLWINSVVNLWLAHYGRPIDAGPWAPPGLPPWSIWQYQGPPIDSNWAKCLPLVR